MDIITTTQPTAARRAAAVEIWRSINSALDKTAPSEDIGVQIGEGAIPKIEAIIARHFPPPSMEAREQAREIMEHFFYLEHEAEDVEDVIAIAITAARPQWEPLCPKCRQAFVCEHCGTPICDYYAAPPTAKEGE